MNAARIRISLGVMALLAALGVTRPASSQSAAAAAEALFVEGRTAMDRGDYATACAKFGESNRLDPALGTEMNLANCEEKRGRLATAWLQFREVARKFPPGDTRLEVVQARIAALEGQVPRLRLVAERDTPGNIRVHVGEVALGPASLGSPIPLDPGEHRVVVSIPGRADESATVRLVAGRTTELRVPLTVSEPAGAPGRAGPATSGESPRTGPAPRDSDGVLGLERRTAALVVGGVGLTGLAVGTVTGIIGLNKEAVGDDNCFDDLRVCNRKGYDANAAARSLATASTIAFAIGIVGIGTGTYLYLTAEPAHAESSSARVWNVGWKGNW